MTSPNYSTFDVRDARTTKNRARIVALENATAEQTQVEDDVYTDINDHIRARNLERKSKIQACIAAFVMFIPSYVASYLYLQERNKWIIFWTLIHFPCMLGIFVLIWSRSVQCRTCRVANCTLS